MGRSAVRNKAGEGATKQIHADIRQLKRRDEVVGYLCNRERDTNRSGQYKPTFIYPKNQHIIGSALTAPAYPLGG